MGGGYPLSGKFPLLGFLNTSLIEAGKEDYGYQPLQNIFVSISNKIVDDHDEDDLDREVVLEFPLKLYDGCPTLGPHVNNVEWHKVPLPSVVQCRVGQDDGTLLDHWMIGFIQVAVELSCPPLLGRTECLIMYFPTSS